MRFWLFVMLAMPGAWGCCVPELGKPQLTSAEACEMAQEIRGEMGAGESGWYGCSDFVTDTKKGTARIVIEYGPHGKYKKTFIFTRYDEGWSVDKLETNRAAWLE